MLKIALAALLRLFRRMPEDDSPPSKPEAPPEKEEDLKKCDAPELSGHLPLTDEQEQIIRHVDGHHARVLAVAGSGKTTTMAHRIIHLMDNRGVKKHQIQVLMFNRLASEEFVGKLSELGLEKSRQPRVNTFHSYAYRVTNLLQKQHWFGDFEEKAVLELRKTIDRVTRTLELNEDESDLEEAKRAISLWKGELIPPSRAGYCGPNGKAYVKIFQDFEEQRHMQNAITFDDFVPFTVEMLKNNDRALEKHAKPLRYIIVDEYQDVNFGQERLIELLASRGADVMVVGDDDQTIYEWRGARSEYILREFKATFDTKPHSDYSLTRSFRFGYEIAQASYNVITHNSNRTEKVLLAHIPTLESHISLIPPSPEVGGHVNLHIAEELIGLVNDRDVKPSEIKVLGRTFAQLNSITTEFLLKKVPFVLEGRAPFVKAGECRVLLDYIIVAKNLDEVPGKNLVPRFLNIANKPTRYLRRATLTSMLQASRSKGESLKESLWESTQNATHQWSENQRKTLEHLLFVLEEIGRKISISPDIRAGELLEWIDNEVKLQDHYKSYYGKGEPSLTRTENITAFQQYARHSGLNWHQFISHINNMDTTQGMDNEDCVSMTTIHRTKGLEFEYVVIPDCFEGFMPVFSENDDPTYDRSNSHRKPRSAEWIENERRLFYVGMTRAKKGLLIGGSDESSNTRKAANEAQSKRIGSRFLEECEFDPTSEIGGEVVAAANRKDGHELIEKCRQYSAYHKIVGVIKQYYSRHFSNTVQDDLAKVQLSAAERPFEYKRSYSNTEGKRKSERKSQKKKGKRWPHIDISTS